MSGATEVSALSGPSVLACVLVLATSVSLARGQALGEIRRLDPPVQGFYSKQLVVRGIPIRAHLDVSDAALEEAGRRVGRQLSRASAIAANLRRLGAEVHLIGTDQQTSDLPEYRDLKGKPFEGEQTIDERGRGYGGLFSSCAEENLLLLPGDRFDDHRDICTHEFAHAILQYGVTSEMRDRVGTQWKRSVAAGRWATMYAGTNAREFFAELSMWYFGSRGDYGKAEPPPSPGAYWLREYDPQAYALLDDLYSGRLKPGALRPVNLRRLSPDREGKVRSLPDQPATEVIFLNRTAEAVGLYWLDFEGQRRSYGVIPAGGVTGQSTYATHAWLLEAADGPVLGIYVPSDKLGRVVVSEQGRAP